MADGDTFLGFLKDTVNSVPILGAYTQAAWGAGNFDPNPKPVNPNPTFQDRAGALLNAIPFAHSLGVATGFVADHVAPLKFALDFGNKTTDSFFGGFAYNDATKDSSLGTWAEGFRKSWDSWGTADHVSAGDLIGASVNEAFGGQAPSGSIHNVNPFTQQGAAAFRDLARRDWYGNIAGGVADLTAGFLTPLTPASGAIKASRAAKVLDTTAKVDAAAEVFHAAQDASKLGDLRPTSGLSLFKDAASPESHAARLYGFAKEAVDHASDQSSAMNFFGPRMENATEASKRVMANTAVLARQLGPELGAETMGNTWLWLMGSEEAGKRVKAASPLMFDAIRTATAPPEHLGVVAKAQTAMLEAFRTGGDIRMDKIMDDVFNTPAKKQQHAAILEALDKAKLDAEEAKTLRTRMLGLRPQFRQRVDGQYVDNFDTSRLKEARVNAENQYQSALAELKMARGDSKGSARFSDASVKTGDAKTANEFGQGLGAADQRVTTAQEKLAQAKADRDLLNSTPLNDPEAMAKWKSEMTSARTGAKGAQQRKDMLAAMARVSREQIKTDAAAKKAISPTLDATNTWLADIWDLGETQPAVLKVSSSRLEKLKTAYHDKVGESFIYQTGEYSPKAIFHRHPTETLASIGTAYGRSAVNTHDIYKGKQELGMYMRKSGVFTDAEILDTVNKFIAAPQGRVAEVVQKANDVMLERMLRNAGVAEHEIPFHLSKSTQTATQVRSYLTGRLAEADANGQKWVTTNEFPDATASDAMHMIDSAYLRSHLSDTVPFTDPSHAQAYVKKVSEMGTVFDKAGQLIGGSTDLFNHVWKTYNLVRPGLFFRNMLDTGLRAMLLMGAADTLYSLDMGTRNFIRNTGVRVGDWSLRHKPNGLSPIQRIGATSGADEMVKWTLGDQKIPVKLGNGKTADLSFYDQIDGHATAASVAVNRSAMTRGAPMHEGLLGTQGPIHDMLVKNLAAWDKYKATDPRWSEAYRDHAQALLASPTAKKMVEHHAVYDNAGDLASPDLIRDLFSDPAVRDEYSKLAARLDMSREAFVEQLGWEMRNMFPEPGMAQDILSGKLAGRGGQKWIEDHFPVEQRFDVPGYESILEHPNVAADNALAMYKRFTDKVFNVLMDKPDFWLVRHPVAVNAYGKQVRLEASKLLEARRAKYGDKAEITAQDIAKINARSRTYAISTVKKYMYDSTYSTEFSQAVHRIAPFFNPWQDAMRAYSKLIFDDPQALGKLAGAWVAPDNLSSWMPQPLVVDINGEEVRRGEEPKDGGGERFYVLSSLIGKTPAKRSEVTGRRVGEGNLKLRQSSFNTILMGNTPWLPGWGPTVAIPMGAALNSKEDVALWLSTSKSPAIHTLMESLWPGGQVPRNDQLWESLKPPWFRKVQDLTSGQGYWRNVQYGMNQRYIEALKNGEPFEPAKWQAEAEKAAMNAGIVSGISQFVFGLSAKADVAGQFYVDEMHQLQALTPEQVKAAGYPSVEAMFMALHPEAANLTWTFSRNETGINATAQAQQASYGRRDLIEKAPDLGWFILGPENVGGEFSQTAYNQQRQDKFGFEQASRKILDPGEQQKQTVAGFGWSQYIAFVNRAEALAAQYGFSPDVLSKVKSAFAEQLGQQNPVWYEDYNVDKKRLVTFYNKADQIAADPGLKDRQDIGMYVAYRDARQQVLNYFGLNSLDGTGANSAKARAALKQIGENMAAQNIGFQQMWERMLSSEVKAKATDTRFGVSYAN